MIAIHKVENVKTGRVSECYGGSEAEAAGEFMKFNGVYECRVNGQKYCATVGGGAKLATPFD